MLLMVVMALGDGIVAFAFRPALDMVLNPQSTAQKLVLFQIPWNQPHVHLNSFVPARVHHVWSRIRACAAFYFPGQRRLRNISAAR